MPSTPALFEMTVSSLAPEASMPAINASGMPQRPKPPDMMVMPSVKRFARASATVE